MGVVKDHQANTSLTTLDLEGNEVGDAGATALADALQATVLACGQELFRACVSCYPVGVAVLLCNLCVCAASVFFLCLEGNHSLVRTVVKVYVARFQNRLGQLSLSPFSFASLQCATTARLQDRGGALRITTVM